MHSFVCGCIMYMWVFWCDYVDVCLCVCEYVGVSMLCVCEYVGVSMLCVCDYVGVSVLCVCV